jgi:hypothetical protein
VAGILRKLRDENLATKLQAYKALIQFAAEEDKDQIYSQCVELLSNLLTTMLIDLRAPDTELYVIPFFFFSLKITPLFLSSSGTECRRRFERSVR